VHLDRGAALEAEPWNAVIDRAVAALYRRFAELEAAGRSPLYVEAARHVADDPRTLGFLVGLPEAKRQPQLLFGAVQYLCGPLTSVAQLDAALTGRSAEIARVMLTRSTQTNIPARCATLLPALAALPQPLALIEVGASAGLCLYPDRYAYDYGGHRIAPAVDAATPVFRCAAGPGTPLPARPVEVVWRAGLDLHPLDITDPDDRAWLFALVWPGEEHLREQLHAAIAVARREPARLHTGDLSRDLPALLDAAPRDATVVVFHTAVLPYVTDPADRQRFAETVRASRAVWLAQETAARIPGLSAATVEQNPAGRFLLCRDGRPLARTDPHGAAIEWLG
jgi:hypothetical protein